MSVCEGSAILKVSVVERCTCLSNSNYFYKLITKGIRNMIQCHLSAYLLKKDL
jgi:hypothetical protein